MYNAFHMHPLHPELQASAVSGPRNIAQAQQLGSALSKAGQQAPLLLLMRHTRLLYCLHMQSL